MVYRALNVLFLLSSFFSLACLTKDLLLYALTTARDPSLDLVFETSVLDYYVINSMGHEVCI